MTNEIELYGKTNVGNYSIVAASSTDETVINMWVMSNSSTNTQEQYKRVSQAFISAVAKPLQAVTLNDLQQWQNSLDGKTNTRKLKVNAIKSLFSFLHKTGYINLNPAVMIKAEKVEETQHTKILSEEQVMKMVLSESLSLRDETIVRCLYSSGMRVSELCNLQWKDVIANGDKAILVIRGKGSKTRQSGISATTYAKMLQLRDDATTDNDYVFVSNRGTNLDRTTVSYLFEKLSVVVGKTISPHYLRHSNATHSLKRGANPVDVMAQLGHSSLAVTTKYVHSDKFSSDVLAI